jgi:hypothetical protein
MAVTLREFLTATLLCGTCLLTTPSLADTREDIRKLYMEAFGENGRDRQGMQQVLKQLFLHYDLDGEGITAAEIDKIERIETAGTHAKLANRVLRYDLSSDMRVTQEEITEVTQTIMGQAMSRRQMNEQEKKLFENDIQKQIDLLMIFDKNRSGVIEGTELYGQPDSEYREDDYLRAEIGFVRALLATDPDQDGLLTEAEVSLLMTQNLDGLNQAN